MISVFWASGEKRELPAPLKELEKTGLKPFKTRLSVKRPKGKCSILVQTRHHIIQQACLDRVHFKKSKCLPSKSNDAAVIWEKKFTRIATIFFLFYFLSPETFGCNFIQRFKSFQFIGYNIETFISCFNTQTMWFSLPSVPESSIVH